jgi:predicted ATPase/class 3 adenylate cyclase
LRVAGSGGWEESVPVEYSVMGSSGVRPAGTVTFLFTDIEGSTARWESDADGMGSALAEHDDVLRTAVESHGGWLFKHTGDGVCAAFADPNAAVMCGIDAQRRLGLPVRMGIATGVADRRGDDYFGPVLNRAARVMAAGHGGQILLAESTRGLVRDLELVDLGQHRLRDLSDPVGISQVVAPGLDADFLPLRTLDASPGNLPVPVTSFLGREREVSVIMELLESHRLVTLTGVGGVGKTRLALHVAAAMKEEFPDGIWFVELAQVGDPAAVPDAVAAALALAPQPGVSISDSVVQGLASRQALVVFDNCEHVLGAAGDLIEAILERSHLTRILATSREGTAVLGEQVWAVPSLDVRGGARSDAVELFIARAQGVDPAFSLTGADDEATVVEICERLDGIALAIELAAARLASMTPVEVCERLGDRFRLLSGGRRGLERHQTLRHTVQWSHDLLDDEERIVLRRCAVFAGGFDLAAAIAVAGSSDIDEFRMLDLLDSLVRKSLLVAGREDGRTRYTMLETIRQFAGDRLVDAGEHLSVQQQHADFFTDGAERNFERWGSPDQRRAYEWLETEQANIRAAFRASTESGEHDTAAALAARAAYPAAFSLWFEPAEWCAELLDSGEARNHRLAKWLHMGAAQLVYVAHADRAVEYAEAGVNLDDDVFEPVPHELDRCSLGIAVMFNGDVGRWLSLAHELDTSPHDDLHLGAASLVWMLALTGDHDQALRRADDVLHRAETTGCPASIAYAHAARGLALAPSSPSLALRALETAVELASSSGNRMFEAVYRREIARLEATRGDPRTALDSLDRIIAAFDRTGDTANLVPTLGYLVLAFHRLRRFDSATLLHGAVTRFPAAAMVPELADVETELQEQVGTESYEQRAADSEGWDVRRTVIEARQEIHRTTEER